MDAREGTRTEEAWERAQRIMGVRIAQAEEKQRRKIEATDETQESNPWLRRVR